MADPILYWRRPARCGHCECVEVAFGDDRVLIRNSKLGDGSPVLTYTHEVWRSLLDLVKSAPGAFAALGQLSDIHPLIDRWPGDNNWCWERNLVHLHYTDAEMDAFVAGVRAGEFDLPEVAP